MAKSLLIYTQRFKAPNRPSTSGKNQAHVVYIGTRPGVMKLSPESTSGLFGNIGKGFQNQLDITEVTAKVRVVSDSKKNIYRSIISFSIEQSKALGLNTLEDWQEYTRKQIPIIAKENGISLANIEWSAAVHQKRDHPHVHIDFWDKSQQIQVQYIKPEKIRTLRGRLLENTYPELHHMLVENKNITKKSLVKNYNELIDECERVMLKENYISELNKDLPDKDRFFDESGLTKLDIAEMMKSDFIFRFVNLRKTISEYEGSLKYKLLPTEIKKEVDSFIYSLVSQNEKLKMLIQNYVSARLDLKEFYTSNVDILKRCEKEYTQEAMKMLANRMLNCIKELNYNQSHSQGVDSSSESENTDEADVINSVFSIFAYLTRLTRQQHSAMRNISSGGDLSRQALIEKSKENKDKGIGVER